MYTICYTNQYVRPTPPQTLHIPPSNIKKVILPVPPHFQHSRPPNRGSPGLILISGGRVGFVYWTDGGKAKGRRNTERLWLSTFALTLFGWESELGNGAGADGA